MNTSAYLHDITLAAFHNCHCSFVVFVCKSCTTIFKNIYLNEKEAEEAKEKGIPVWDGGKVPSGWLIEHAGLKGKEFYGMRVSDKAALILINENAKNYADLARARQAVIDAVKEKFGYTLEQEPMELGDE